MNIQKYHNISVHCNNENQIGFTLIEVLISMVILSLGLLGIFAMQSRALMDNQDAYLRTQAVFMAYDMSDRIRANAEYWENNMTQPKLNTILNNAKAFDTAGKPKHPFCNAYDPTTTTFSSPLAVPIACSPQQMAEYDAYRWSKNVSSILPGGSVTLTNIADPNTSSTAKDIIRLTINWQRANQNFQNNLGSNASYSLDIRL